MIGQLVRADARRIPLRDNSVSASMDMPFHIHHVMEHPPHFAEYLDERGHVGTRRGFLPDFCWPKKPLEMDDQHATVQWRALRDLSGGARATVHPCRQ